MEIKNNRKSAKSSIVPVLLSLLVIAGIVAVTTSFHKAVGEAGKKSEVQAVAKTTEEASTRDSEKGDKAETERPAWLSERDKQGEDTTASPESETEAVSPAEPEVPAEPTFISPVSGVVTKGFSADVPVFSETMNDYRVHSGVDVSASAGEAEAALSAAGAAEAS